MTSMPEDLFAPGTAGEALPPGPPERLRSIDELFQAAKIYRSGEEFQQLLNFCRRFSGYAPYNCFLLHMQKPGVRYVATVGQWRKRFNRAPRPGARPLLILAPQSPVMFVYDIDDTADLDPAHPYPVPDDAATPFKAFGDIEPSALRRTTENCRFDGIDVGTADFGTDLAGRVTREPGNQRLRHREADISLKIRILVNQNHDVTTRYATLVHELAHVHCGHLGGDKDKWWPDRPGASKEVMEVEAETVCHLVCTRQGVDPRSSRYLSQYLTTGQELPAISLDLVLRVAGYIELLGRRTLSRPRGQRRR